MQRKVPPPTLPPLPGPIGLYNVSVLPRFICDSRSVGWQGAFFTSIVGAPAGTVDQVHRNHCLIRAVDPIEVRSRGSLAWDVAPRGLNVWRPGDEQQEDWRRRSKAQFLFVSPQQFERVIETPRGAFAGAPRRHLADRLPGFVFDALEEDLAQGSPAGSLVGEGLITALLAHLAGLKPPVATLSVPARGRVLDFIEEHLAARLSLADLAEVAGTGVRQFSRAFRRATGQSPHQYLLHRRVERARGLIAEGRPLAEVALHCGFGDQSQLTRVFARRVGTTPARYRDARRR
jgi:AraC-like DNA-binding protein